MKEHNCKDHRIYITCDKACDECNYEGIEQQCPIIMYGVCEICGNPINITRIKTPQKPLKKHRDIGVS